MKKFLLLTGILLSGISLFAQQLDGTYKNGADSLAFSNEKVIFRISGFGGLSSAHAGEGTYELAGDYLFIHTSDYSGNKTTYELLDGSGKDTCVVHTVSPQNYAVQGILVESRTKSGKLVSGKVTGNDGKVFFTPCHKISSLSATSLGYHSISLDYTPGKDYRIRLAENDIIENRTVAFKINFIDEETLSLLMLTDDFDTGRNREKELQKLENRARKTNKLDKRLKKVYIPYNRRN
ncbi:hypothetical protein [Proteiniphilum sp. X52]|uniref:hypothetical protein n=1 Tax=Proteiniphilum sp. X52 TaxID=2382159 RepID=UPI000F09BCAC|nr:hypothetical protein [Proteiniphilum sp. X52]RNC66847.1 hypothetical protein D7D25_00860 [Proteiniphilum sp. X52]